MIITIQTEPADEPVTVAEAKSYLRVDHSDEDTLIGNLIQTARVVAEQITSRAFITQTWYRYLEEWPSQEILLPRPPLQSVTAVTYTKSGDGSQYGNIWSIDEYDVDTNSEPGRIIPAYGEDWPSDSLDTTIPIRIEYIAGYGDAGSDVPETIRQWILNVVAHLYENRGVPEPASLPVGTLWPYRVWWL